MVVDRYGLFDHLSSLLQVVGSLQQQFLFQDAVDALAGDAGVESAVIEACRASIDTMANMLAALQSNM